MHALCVILASLSILALGACSGGSGDDGPKNPIGEQAFTTVWLTSNEGESASNQIRLPLEDQGVYDFTVDWGDGTSDVITAWDAPEATHTYATAGQYEVKITGTIQGFSFGTRPYNASPKHFGDSLKLLEIKSWGPLRLGNRTGYFYCCSNMTISATDILSLDGTTNATMMFAYCNSLSIVPSIEQWDTSNVTTMQWMFYCASSFNQSIDSWDVSNVTDISFMFGFANAFNQNISDWNIANVTDMTQFLYSSSLSTTNYDALLIAWSNLPALQRNVSLNTLPAKYSSAASAARQKLITDYGWTITDGGLAP